MPDLQPFKSTIFNLSNQHEFEQTALELFYTQAENNTVYVQFLKNLGVKPDDVTQVDEIPFLPISFFKSHNVKSGSFKPEIIFTSSGTTGTSTSRHAVKDLSLYVQSFETAFRAFYGPSSDYCIVALLPAYLERSGSSLVYMANKLIENSTDERSGFYLNNYHELIDTLRATATNNTPTLLLGVSFALLDVAELLRDFHHPNLIVMETGGMKGRRKELIREELHRILKSSFHVPHIHSEYGMTELLSQAYSKGDGIYKTPPWMSVLIRDTTDPLSLLPKGRTGGINIIDLANAHSCAFIATEDLGRLHADGSFEVMGRFDQADIRGCNLMVL
jgi:phenylacetate-coenzyme A ligase PaaK-like adenylate-forming protein